MGILNYYHYFMFTVLQDIWQHFNPQIQHVILFLGLDFSGKTLLSKTLISKMSEKKQTEEEYEKNYNPTIGLNIKQFIINKSKFLIWDVGGKLSVRKLWPNWTKNSNIIFFLVDSSDQSKYYQSVLLLKDLILNTDNIYQFNPQLSYPIYLIINKSDLIESDSYPK